MALITFLAHIGSFVPAEAALIGKTDRILTRIQRYYSSVLRLIFQFGERFGRQEFIHDRLPTSGHNDKVCHLQVVAHHRRIRVGNKISNAQCSAKGQTRMMELQLLLRSYTTSWTWKLSALRLPLRQGCIDPLRF